MPLAERDIETRGDDDRGADPGPQIRKITKDQIAERRRAEQLDIAKRRDDRGRASLKGLNYEVMPGATKQPQAAEQRYVEEESITRIGEPADIAALAAFIVSPEGRFLHGSLIDMDGGSTKTI